MSKYTIMALPIFQTKELYIWTIIIEVITGSPKIDIIKMDIEGAEVLALAGMKKTIARNPKIIIFTEFYPKAIERLGHSPMAFLKELITLGFSLSVINEDKSSLTNIENLEKFVSDFPGGEAFRNILATRKK